MKDSNFDTDHSDVSKVHTENNKVIVHIHCIQCGYDLFGHLVNSRCSECGRSVNQTLKYERRKPSDLWLPQAISILTPILLAWSIASPKTDNLSAGAIFMRLLAYSELVVPVLLLALMIYAITSAERTSMLIWHMTAMITMLGMVLSITVIPALAHGVFK